MGPIVFILKLKVKNLKLGTVGQITSSFNQTMVFIGILKLHIVLYSMYIGFPT